MASSRRVIIIKLSLAVTLLCDFHSHGVKLQCEIFHTVKYFHGVNSLIHGQSEKLSEQREHGVKFTFHGVKFQIHAP